MGGAVKNKETQGNMKKQALTRTETGCGYQSCRTVTCSGAALRVSPSCWGKISKGRAMGPALVTGFLWQGLRSHPKLSTWNLWWVKWHGKYHFSQYFSFHDRFKSHINVLNGSDKLTCGPENVSDYTTFTYVKLEVW